MKTTNEPQYRIYWRVTTTDRTGRSTCTFSREMAELWVNAFNRDRYYQRIGLVNWMEEEQSLPPLRIAE